MNKRRLIPDVFLPIAVVIFCGSATILIATSEESKKKSKGRLAQMEELIPSENIGEFITERLDLTTFRNSFGPKRAQGQRHFKDFGIVPTKTTKDIVEFDTDDWFYAVHIVSRRDVNRDGLIDLVVRFHDDSKKGSYASGKRFLLTRFEADGNLVALAYTP